MQASTSDQAGDPDLSEDPKGPQNLNQFFPICFCHNQTFKYDSK